MAEATRVQGTFLRDVLKNADSRNFRIFSPDKETASNRWNDSVFEVTDRESTAEHLPTTARTCRRTAG